MDGVITGCMARTRDYYIDRDEFHNALQECKAIGEPTVKVCNFFRLLIRHYLHGSRYAGYSTHEREDLASAALLKCLKNVRNYNPERGSPFSYYTLCCECACKDYLKKHYEQVNIKRDLREMGDTAQWHEDVHEM